MIGISLLKNPVRDYAWGSRTALQSLLRRPEATGSPMAELWMGAHPAAPSKVKEEGRWTSLAEVIRRRPESVLGGNVSQAFSGRLPFLFKALGVGRPLSIQAHPNSRQAKAGYARENRDGVPLDAPERNYRDESHKPELICALSPFRLLAGFREAEDIRRLLGELLPRSSIADMPSLAGGANSNDLRALFVWLMTMDEGRRRRLVGEAAGAAREMTNASPLFHWVSELADAFPGDVGALSPLIMNFEALEPGEAVYVPAGVLHAYLDGTGIELMANSDNVLRGGLTGKHVDIPELLSVLDFSPAGSVRVPAVAAGPCERAFPAPAAEFLLSEIHVTGAMPYAAHPGGVEIILCTAGAAVVTGEKSAAPIRLGGGDAVLVPGSVPHYGIEGEATLYRASVPND